VKIVVKIGDRVGAMLSCSETEVHLLGFGTYQGVNPVPGRSPGWSSPEILLDNGETVYGYECWWDEEEGVRELLKGRTVIPAKVER